MNSKKNNKIIFSEEIDKLLQGFSLVLTFIVVGIMLQFFPSFFGNVNKAVTVIFIIIGILGFFCEIDNVFKNQNLKGSSELLTGFILLALTIGIKYYVHIPESWPHLILIILNIIIIFFVFLAIYELFNGIIYFLYSLKKESSNLKKKSMKFTISKLLIDFLGLLLVVLQIVNVLIRW